jgi:hypothetical protein
VMLFASFLSSLADLTQRRFAGTPLRKLVP